jgi:hypothetical protein
MDNLEFLTRATIWMALVTYTGAEVYRSGLLKNVDDRRSRTIWSLGCLLYVTHVVSAFHHTYHWSHTVAATETLRQTELLIGTSWSGGIFINYLFTLFWCGETAWWWLKPTDYLNRPLWVQRTTWTVFLFMIINGAVVFVEGPMRWFGASIAVTLVWTWQACRRRLSRDRLA